LPGAGLDRLLSTIGEIAITQERTLPIAAGHREFIVKVNGQAMAREHQLLGASITKEVNRLAAARLTYLDGAAASGEFPLSESDLFLPGAEVEILAGPDNDPVSLFQGIVVRQSLRIRQQGSAQLVVDCRHQAVKLTVGRKNAYYFDQKDSDIIATLLDNASLSSADVEATRVSHKQLVQYQATDWDFLVMRAEANGKLVLTNGANVVVKAPHLGGSAACTLLFGATILELDAEMDCRQQYQAVRSSSWDAAQQSVDNKDGADPGIAEPGNVAAGDLAGVAGLDHVQLQSASLVADEAQAWADAQWLSSQMARVSGLIKCEGIGTLQPGDLAALDGVGKRFNGKVFVSGVRHDFDTVQGWKSHLQFGRSARWLGEEPSVSAPAAGALLPAVHGLQIGVVVSNEDPDGEDRVRVRMPLVDQESDGTWARVATLDAGKERGFFFRPELDDEVLLGFLNDDPRQVVILGMLHSSAHPAPLAGSDDNHEKLYQSRSKMKLYFNDDTKVMRLETPAGNGITLSEADKAIKIVDQSGNKIEMTPDGITIESCKAITLKSGTEQKIESGSTLTMESSGSCAIKAGADLKLEGSSGAELSSGATTKVKGSMVQLN